MAEPAHSPDGLFNVKRICEASFRDLIKSPRLLFSRAFFIDNFKGVPREKIRENATKENGRSKEFQHEGSAVDTQMFIKTKSTAYYKSLTYTLSLLNNSSEESSSNEGDGMGKEAVRPSQPQGIACQDVLQEYPLTNVSEERQPDSELDSETDEEDLIRKMQALGLPICFGRQQQFRKTPKTRRTGNPVSAKTRENYPAVNIENLVLLGIARDPEPIKCLLRTSSAEDLIEQKTADYRTLQFQGCLDDLTLERQSLFISSLCRTLGLSYSFSHPRSCSHRSIEFMLPEDWKFATTRSIFQKIQASLTACRCCRYKPKVKCLPSTHSPSSRPTQLADLIPPSGDDGHEDADELAKYWAQRYRFFSRFDNGIQINREGLFSVTPEVIAAHQAQRMALLLNSPSQPPTIVDLFAGVGGNSIQFALMGFKVIAVDINPEMLRLVSANAKVYGVEESIQLVQSDVFDWLDGVASSTSSLPAFDAAFASPPWGGPGYNSRAAFDLSSLTFDGRHRDIWFLTQHLMRLTHSGPVGLFLPRNVNIIQLFDLCRQTISPDCSFNMEIELSLIHGKAKGLTVYFAESTRWTQGTIESPYFSDQSSSYSSSYETADSFL